MKSRLLVACVLSVGLLTVCGPVMAHHGNAAYADKMTEFKNVTITKFSWANPHSLIFFDVKDANGKVEQWSFEAGTPSGMIRNGYKPNIIKQGAEVTIKGYRARDASQKMGMLRELTTADGQVFGMFGPQEGPAR